MLNKRPIFIVSISFSGTNILLNLLLSHPNVCVPRGETLQVFIGRGEESLQTRFGKLLRYLPIVFTEGYHVLSENLWKPRSPLNTFTKIYIDKVLYAEKLKTHLPGMNLYKTENVKYTLDEIAKARILCKNQNGLIFMSTHFAEMYPDATFIALVRNGLAVCEGHIRRGDDLVEFAANYERGYQQIILDSQRISNFHIIRYEDIITNPLDLLREIYDLADLDINQVKKIRLESKKVIGKDGKHNYFHGTNRKQVIWYEQTKLRTHFRTDVNRNQIDRLNEVQKSKIISLCKDSLEYFDYL